MRFKHILIHIVLGSVLSASFNTLPFNRLCDINLSTPEPNVKSFSLLWENDFFIDTDHHYTNGMQFQWSSFTQEAKYTRALTHYIAMNMYTPENINRIDFDPNDRPYAGMIRYGIRQSNSYNDGWLISQDISFGIIGPNAKQGELQDGWHELIRTGKFRGWHNQVGNDIALQYKGVYGYHFLKERNHTKLLPYLNLELGTVFNRIGIGGLFKVGDVADLGIDVSPSQSQMKKTPGLGDTSINPESIDPKFMMFLRAEVNAVAYNAMLQGGIFNDNNIHTTGLHHIVTDLELGISIKPFEFIDREPYTNFIPFIKNLNITYSYNVRSSESDVHKWTWDRHKWGAMTFTWRY